MKYPLYVLSSEAVWGTPCLLGVSKMKCLGSSYAMLTKGGDGIPAQRLLNEGIDIRQKFSVREIGQTIIPNHTVKFCLSCILDVWVKQHCEKETINRGHSLSIWSDFVWHTLRRAYRVCCARIDRKSSIFQAEIIFFAFHTIFKEG